MPALARVLGLLLGLSLCCTAAAAQTPCSQRLITDPTSADFLTGDTPFNATQEDMNCYAWQTFMALNWPVDPGWPASAAKAGEPDRSKSLADFGLPGPGGEPMSNTAVWQSFITAPDVFKPGAATPEPWGYVAPAPPGCGVPGAANSGHGRVLNSYAKSGVSPVHGFNLLTGTQSNVSDEILQATGGWLTDQAGNLVFYERLIGKAEYDYIVAKGLYDAANQLRVATNADGNTPEGLSLPKGARASGTVQPQEDLGAFEIKVAWRILTGQPQLYPRYLTTTGYLTGPDGTCTQQVVGLVGMHIIHKTASMPNLIWTTFEQIDNVPGPGKGSGTPPAGYSFNNPASSDPANVQPTCTPACDYAAPVQVSRDVPISADLDTTNSGVQQLFAAQTGGSSVYQYYQLVNVLWDGGAAPPLPEPGANAQVPLNYGTFQSENNAPVANTVLETYIQLGTPRLGASCNACHQSATIAGSKTLAADFSFLFGVAASSTATPGISLSKEFTQ